MTGVGNLPVNPAKQCSKPFPVHPALWPPLRHPNRCKSDVDLCKVDCSQYQIRMGLPQSLAATPATREDVSEEAAADATDTE